MKLFDGLYSYESVLLVLGGVLFITLIFAFIWQILKGKTIVPLLPFFLLPVIMIGYPSIESIQYENGKLAFNKKLQELEQDPSDTVKREQLVTLYRQLEGSYNTSKDPAMLTSFSRAQYILGNYDQAVTIGNRAVSLDPRNQEARQILQKSNNQIKATAEFEQKINRLDANIQALERAMQSGNPPATEAMVRELSGINPPDNIDRRSALVLAKALAITGQKENAIEVTNRITASEKDTAEAANLREAIRRDQYTVTDAQPTPEQQSLLNRNKALSPESINKLNLRTPVWTDTTRNN